MKRQYAASKRAFPPQTGMPVSMRHIPASNGNARFDAAYSRFVAGMPVLMRHIPVLWR
jgi:hypothetical protein